MKRSTSSRLSFGFTMIELLVAATILAILTTIGMVSFRTASMKSRDGKRQADLSQVQAALELYRSSVGNGQYPAGPFNSMITTLRTNQYISEPLPSDPRNSGTFVYTYSPSGSPRTTYCLCAQLEGGGGNRSNSTCGGSPGNFYCLTNP